MTIKPTGAEMKYGVEVGQIYIAADGSKCGHLVTDVTTFADVDDVVTTPFTASGWGEPGNRIDNFKLACVRYRFVAEQPEWMPDIEGIAAMKSPEWNER